MTEENYLKRATLLMEGSIQSPSLPGNVKDFRVTGSVEYYGMGVEK